MVTQEQAAEIERKTRYQSKSLHGARRAAVELHLLSLVKSAGGFPVHRRILLNSILNQLMYQLRHCPVPGERTTKTEHRVLINEWHERGHFSLVINPAYSWLGVSLDGVVHDPGFEIKCPYNYCDNTPFQAASQKEFVGWKRVGLGGDYT